MCPCAQITQKGPNKPKRPKSALICHKLVIFSGCLKFPNKPYKLGGVRNQIGVPF